MSTRDPNYAVPRGCGPLILVGVLLLLFGVGVACLGVDVREAVAKMLGME